MGRHRARAVGVQFRCGPALTDVKGDPLTILNSAHPRELQRGGHQAPFLTALWNTSSLPTQREDVLRCSGEPKSPPHGVSLYSSGRDRQ